MNSMFLRRRALALTISVMVAIVAVSCGGGATPAEEEQEEHCVPTSPQNLAERCIAADEKLEIVLIQGTSAHSFYISVAAGANEAGEDFDVNVDVQGAAEFSPQAQTPIINAVIERKPHALIMVPTDPTALQERLIAVAEAGIVVFTADNDTTDPDLRVSQIASDNELAGVIAAHTLAKAIGEEGKVLVLSSDPTNLVPEQRLAGFLEWYWRVPEHHGAGNPVLRF